VEQQLAAKSLHLYSIVATFTVSQLNRDEIAGAEPLLQILGLGPD
jgi:hypothetical protein